MLLFGVLLVALILKISHPKPVSAPINSQQQSSQACGAYRNDKRITIGKNKLNTEVVVSKSEKIRGLSGRPCITAKEAMLFVFDKPAQYQFWMKDMKFPVDIIWVSAEHKAAVVEENVLPSSYPDRFVNPVNHPAQYVLEIQAHASTKLGINPGTAIEF